MSKSASPSKRMLWGAAASMSLLFSAGVAQAGTPFQNDVATAINNGLNHLKSAGVYSNPSSVGINSAQGLAMLALLEKRASGNPSDPPQGYSGATAADQGYLRSAAAFILANANQGFYAYRDGAWMMGLASYALTNGLDKTALAAATPPWSVSYTLKQAMDMLVNRTVAQQYTSGGCSGFWGYTGPGCDSSTTQFAAAGLNAAKTFYASLKSTPDSVFADAAQLAKVNAALALVRTGYATRGQNAADYCNGLSATERGHGYQVNNAGSMQQTGSGIYVQLFGGADVNDPAVQQYMQYIRNRYRYTDVNAGAYGPYSYGYYLWSSFKGMEIIRQAGVAVNPGNIGPNDYGTLPAASAPACSYRQVNRDPSAVAQPALFGGAAAGVYAGEAPGQYFDYASTLIAMQCADGNFTCTGFPNDWVGWGAEGNANNSHTSHNSYALLVLQRATGVVVQKCDVNGDGKVTAADLAIIRARNGQKSSGPDDPADANGDGVINVADYRYCALHLTP